MEATSFRASASLCLALSCAYFGCSGSNSGLAGDDETQGGTSGSAGDNASGGSGDTSGTGGSVSGSGGQGGGSSGTTGTGGATTGGTGSGTGGTSAPTGGTSGTGATGGTTPRPPGRPTISLPYTDDFETSEAADWRFISVPWTVIDDDTKVLELSSTGDSETTWAVGGDRNWTDVRVEMRVKFVSGDGMILLSPKWKDLDSYAFVEYEAEDKPKLRRRLNGSTQDIITAADTMTFALGQWHTVAVTLKGTMASLEFDGTPIGTGTDSTPVPNGGIGIAVENGIVAIDDVSVTEAP